VSMAATKIVADRRINLVPLVFILMDLGAMLRPVFAA